MDVTRIPFVSLVDIKNDGHNLSLEPHDKVLNHIQTIHAGGLFTLAETQSGYYLQQLFPDLEGKVLPILREAHIKYKKPAIAKTIADPNCPDEAVETFQKQLENKGRASIVIYIDIKDSDNGIIGQASFNWFVQKL